jgi:hypothetical protein
MAMGRLAYLGGPGGPRSPGSTLVIVDGDRAPWRITSLPGRKNLLRLARVK